MVKRKETEVLIIGAGITGCSIARELTRYQMDVTVIEKEIDVGMGISKTSGSVIYMGLFQAMSIVIKDLGHGIDYEKYTRTERMQMLWDGFQLFDRIAHELDIPHRHVGHLSIARNEDELEKLKTLERMSAFVSGAELGWLGKKELFEMEPNITRDAVAALYDATGTTSIFGPEFVIAVYENARSNRANILLETECLGVEEENGFQIVSTNKGTIKARFVIN